MDQVCGSHLFEITLRITDQVDFGQPLVPVLAGRTAIPSLGLRIDTTHEGEVKGLHLRGTIKGIDYFQVVGDGSCRTHAHDVITTADGARIAVVREGIGVAHLNKRIATLRQTATLYTACERYAWVNQMQFWLVGEHQMQQDLVTLRAYAAPIAIATS